MRNYSRLPEPDQLDLEQVSQSRKAEQLQQLYFTHHHRTKAISLAEAREVLAPLRYDLDQAIAKMGLPPRPKRVVAPSTVPPLAPKPIVKQPSRPMQLARQASRGLYRVVSPPQRLPSSEIQARENVRHGADSVKYLFWLCALTYLSVYVALSIPVNVRTVEMARSRYLWPLGTCLRRGVPRVEEHVLCGKCVHSSR